MYPFTFTLVRETFNLWTPTYFVQVVGLSQADAARGSALLPLFGGLSVLLSGVSDRLKQGGRAAIIFYGLLFAGAVLFLLGHLNFHASRHLPVALVTLVAFLMSNPTPTWREPSRSTSVVRKAARRRPESSTESSLWEESSRDSVARVSIAYGWHGAFTILAGVVWLTSVASFLYRRHLRAQTCHSEVVLNQRSRLKA